MDKPSRVGYGLHRRNTQPAKSARYWSASTCFTRWTFISTWQTSPISSCAATRADLSPGRPQPEPRSKSQRAPRSEEHTSELQSPCNLVCRLLLEKKKKKTLTPIMNSDRIRTRPHTTDIDYHHTIE